MTVRAALHVCLGLAVGACSGGADETAAQKTEAPNEPARYAAIASEPTPSSTPTPSSQLGDNDWIDPEPEGAQELAERMLTEPFNEDKSRHLTMRISRLVDHTTGLRGFATEIRSEDTSLDDRLARLGAEETELEVRIRLPGSILFDFNSDEIRPDAERTLLELVEVLKAYGTRPVRIEGHTDSISSDAYNQRLSEQRAAAVSSWLEAHGIATDRLSTMGYGESQPAATNDTAAGRQLNRRVEVVIEKAAS
jgi:outer membrane protein OmpA-like peptidoglycan-associated protein